MAVIRIKYAEHISRAEEASDKTSRTPSEASFTSKELLVNINCNIGLITDYIRESVCLESTEEFDLWEASTSQLKNISSQKSWESGLKLFQPNDTYSLIIIERNSTGQLVNYMPMFGGKISRSLSEIITKIKKGNKLISSPMLTPLRSKSERKKLPGKSK